VSESRKDWIAARKLGTRIGWFGGSPEADAEPIALARPREFDTIVATELPEDGLQPLLEQLPENGRLLVALPFGAPYPSALIDQLRGSTVPIELDLADGELRIAAERKAANHSSWDDVASPDRLLEITERGSSEREAKRSVELDTLRSAYKRLAERLMARASDQAGPSIATASRVLALEDRVADLAERLKTLDESPDARAGRALLEAARSPRHALALPVRLLRAFTDSRQRPPPALPPPAPVDRELLSLVRRSPDRLALIVDGRRFDEAGGLERELAMEGWSVVLAASKESNEMKPAQKILRTQIELLTDLFPTLERADASHRLAIFRTPHPVGPRWINRLNAWGWITIYDCFEDWPEKLRLGQPHRYRRSVERFLVHNADVVCATESCAERLRSLTSREPAIVEEVAPAARGRALIEAASRVRTAGVAEKTLHARDGV
jgi:hypothetical protein